jgi:hypothetical protein
MDLIGNLSYDHGGSDCTEDYHHVFRQRGGHSSISVVFYEGGSLTAMLYLKDSEMSHVLTAISHS